MLRSCDWNSLLHSILRLKNHKCSSAFEVTCCCTPHTPKNHPILSYSCRPRPTKWGTPSPSAVKGQCCPPYRHPTLWVVLYGRVQPLLSTVLRELNVAWGGCWCRMAIRSWHRDSEGPLGDSTRALAFFLGGICFFFIWSWRILSNVICLLQFTAEYSHRNISRMHTI